jgi:hypothetical protein
VTSAPEPMNKSKKARPYDECIEDSLKPSGSLVPGATPPSPIATRTCLKACSATCVHVMRSGSETKANTPARPTSAPARHRLRQHRAAVTASASNSAPAPQSGEVRRPSPSPSDISRRSTNERRMRSTSSWSPKSVVTPPSSLPVSMRLTRSQSEPAATPAAPYSATATQRRRGWLANTTSASAGSAKTVVSFVPSARASARAPSASSMRAAPIAKYAQAIRSDATTRSLSAVGVCSITTVKVENASAAKTAARRSKPRRRATPTIATQAKANATSWTRPT